MFNKHRPLSNVHEVLQEDKSCLMMRRFIPCSSEIFSLLGKAESFKYKIEKQLVQTRFIHVLIIYFQIQILPLTLFYHLCLDKNVLLIQLLQKLL